MDAHGKDKEKTQRTRSDEVLPSFDAHEKRSLLTEQLQGHDPWADLGET